MKFAAHVILPSFVFALKISDARSIDTESTSWAAVIANSTNNGLNSTSLGDVTGAAYCNLLVPRASNLIIL
jgi:hypothetical protein